MGNIMHRYLGWILILVLLALPLDVRAEEGDSGDEEEVSFNEAIEGLDQAAGLMSVYSDQDKGRVLVAFPPAGDDGISVRVIYAEYLRAGLGSNPVGLDRSQQGVNYVLAFHRMGSKLVAEVENTAYRALTDNLLEQGSVRQSFAASVIWVGEIAAEADDGRLLVDISSFLLRDVHGIAQRLEDREQGKFALSTDLSFVDPSAALVFPENIELESILTFTSSDPGDEVDATTPEPRNLSIRMHHSFIQLPDDGYTPRQYDPRAGGIGMGFQNYAAGLDESIHESYAIRHRLQKTDPNAAVSDVVEPIVYYVDSGAPENIKEALIEGASWWADAFEAAGFKNAFRVEALPEGVNPLDARYNIINWVHRQTRGWSYGGSVVDPRTGEIIKGNVLLGSLRVRQDRMIYEGLVGVDLTGSGAPGDPVEVALARIRQLSAHEVGHTLGFTHNMAASTVFDRSSVMDYPAPRVGFNTDGSIDLSEAYAVGMGVWDDFTVKWLYSEFSEGTDEAEALDAIVDDGYAAGLRFVADRHSRPFGTANPYGALWDTGSDPVASLYNQMNVRAAALDNFGEGNIQPGVPLSELRNVIVPVYLFHRYQMQAAAKSIGGMYFGYPNRGDGQTVATIVNPARQWEAFEAVLLTLSPAALDLSDQVLDALNPGQFGFGEAATREMFNSNTGDVFDLLAAADVAAGLSFQELLHPARVSRLVAFHRRNAAYPDLSEMLERIEDYVFGGSRTEPARQAEIRLNIQARYVSELIELSLSEGLGHGVKMRVDAHLQAMADRLGRGRTRNALLRMHYGSLVRQINAHLSRPAEARDAPSNAPPAPPGSPIGADSDMCWFCEVNGG
jgi:Met-zincin/Domain of unknown function (DUF5117)